MIVNQTLLMRAGPLVIRRGKVLDTHDYLHILWGDHVIVTLGNGESIDKLKAVCARIVAGETDGYEDWIVFQRHIDFVNDKEVQRYVIWNNEEVIGILDGPNTAQMIITVLEERNGPARQAAP